MDKITESDFAINIRYRRFLSICIRLIYILSHNTQNAFLISSAVSPEFEVLKMQKKLYYQFLKDIFADIQKCNLLRDKHHSNNFFFK